MNAKIAAIADYFEFEDSIGAARAKLPGNKIAMLIETSSAKLDRMKRVCGVDQVIQLDPDLLDAAADAIIRRKHDRKLSMERKQRRIQRNREYSADLQLAGLI